jgi:hypothetical protein
MLHHIGWLSDGGLKIKKAPHHGAFLLINLGPRESENQQT